jgi:nucleoid-associated protein YgaU
MATGDPTLWPLLYRANRDQIKDPSLLYPGQRLTIPDFDETPAVAGAPAPKFPKLD